MYCPNCWRNVAETETKCGICGNPPLAGPTPRQTPQQQEKHQKRIRGQDRVKKWDSFFIVASVIILLVMFPTLYYFPLGIYEIVVFVFSVGDISTGLEAFGHLIGSSAPGLLLVAAAVYTIVKRRRKSK